MWIKGEILDMKSILEAIEGLERIKGDKTITEKQLKEKKEEADNMNTGKKTLKS